MGFLWDLLNLSVKGFYAFFFLTEQTFSSRALLILVQISLRSSFKGSPTDPEVLDTGSNCDNRGRFITIQVAQNDNFLRSLLLV